MDKMSTTEIVQQIMFCFKNKGTVWIFGNGGSLADASHFAAEFNLIGPVYALNDPAKITAIGNDYGFMYIFMFQLRECAKKNDLVIGVSSSGKSNNVNLELEWAQKNGIKTIDWPRVKGTTQDVQNYQYQLFHQVYLLVKNSLSKGEA